MAFDPENTTPPGAKIKVIGVGGGGGNAVNTMIRDELEGVDFVTCNTDVQSLQFSLCENRIQVGRELTKGLGAGADPDVGREAALEDRHELQQALEGADMVFVTAGMGGGTGTGGAAVVAQIARELGALTVAVVTKPFQFEGKRRRRHAEAGVARLRECVDTLITIPNQRLLQVAPPDLTMINAFKMADEVLVNAVRGISDIINIPGTVNVDFSDVKTIMSCMGQALMGIGRGEGEGRAITAAQQAINSPLLEDIDIEGATGILINITAGSNITLMEVNEACSVVQEAAHEDANIIFGAVIDESLNEQIRVTVIATGFPVEGEADTAIDPGTARTPSSQIIQPFATRLTTTAGVPLSKSAARSSSATARRSPVNDGPYRSFAGDEAATRPPVSGNPQRSVDQQPGQSGQQQPHRSFDQSPTGPANQTTEGQGATTTNTASRATAAPYSRYGREADSSASSSTDNSHNVGDGQYDNNSLHGQPQPADDQRATQSSGDEPAVYASQSRPSRSFVESSEAENLANWTLNHASHSSSGSSEDLSSPSSQTETTSPSDQNSSADAGHNVVAPTAWTGEYQGNTQDDLALDGSNSRDSFDAQQGETNKAWEVDHSLDQGSSDQVTTASQFHEEPQVDPPVAPAVVGPEAAGASGFDGSDLGVALTPSYDLPQETTQGAPQGPGFDDEANTRHGASANEHAHGAATVDEGPEGDPVNQIDQRIDEALELAERIKAGQARKEDGKDDLDVPAFLRNGMKDLSLD